MKVKERLNKNVMFEQRYEGGDDVNHADIWRRHVLGTGKSKCKSLEVRTYLSAPGTARDEVWLPGRMCMYALRKG